MGNAVLKCFTGPNFAFEGCQEFAADSDFLRRPDVLLDERTMFLTYNIDKTNWNWYFNYIDFTRIIAAKNSNARAGYLLNLGYFPVVYLPTCFSQIESHLIHILDVTQIPYVKLHKSSFALRKVDLEGFDIWVSKMDAAKILGCAPEDVRANDFIRRVLLNV